MFACVTSLLRNWPNLQEKDQLWNFHDLLDARQNSQRNSEKIFDCYDYRIHKKSMIEFFLQYNNIDNLKILWLFLYSRDFLEMEK